MRFAVRIVSSVFAVAITVVALITLVRGVQSDVPEKAHLWKMIAWFIGIMVLLLGVMSLLKRYVRPNHKRTSHDNLQL